MLHVLQLGRSTATPPCMPNESQLNIGSSAKPTCLRPPSQRPAYIAMAREPTLQAIDFDSRINYTSAYYRGGNLLLRRRTTRPSVTI